MSNIKKNVENAFETANQLLLGTQLFNFKETLESIRLRLEQPMQVAVIGEICSSKSTLVNAMLGEEEIVRTGIKEETFNVSWLKYGDPSSDIIVHFRELAKQKAKIQHSEWDVWANRLGQASMKENVSYIEVSHDSEALKIFNIIDTPGLNAHYGVDSKNTLEFLQKVRPDAVILLFTKNIAQRMIDVLKGFQGSYDDMTPVNTIGVLAKVDDYWPSESDPIDAGKRIAKRLFTEETAVKNTMYQLYPVCARLALGAIKINKLDMQLFKQFLNLDDKSFKRLISSVKRFQMENEYVTVTPNERKYLNHKFTRYGIACAVNLMKDNPKVSEDELCNYLLEKSGFDIFYKSLLKHFGHRSYLIKLSGVFYDIRKLVETTMLKTEGGEKAVVQKIGNMFTTLALRQHELQELEIIRSFYSEEIILTESEKLDLKNITGENGISYVERLGMTSSTSIKDMKLKSQEKCDYWHIKFVSSMMNPKLKKACRILENSYRSLGKEIEDIEKDINDSFNMLWNTNYGGEKIEQK